MIPYTEWKRTFTESANANPWSHLRQVWDHMTTYFGISLYFIVYHLSWVVNTDFHKCPINKCYTRTFLTCLENKCSVTDSWGVEYIRSCTEFQIWKWLTVLINLQFDIIYDGQILEANMLSKSESIKAYTNHSTVIKRPIEKNRTSLGKTHSLTMILNRYTQSIWSDQRKIGNYFDKIQYLNKTSIRP